MTKEKINVIAGIVINDGQILIAQRKKGKNHEFFWEFPGGKVEKGESSKKCLKREFLEELGLNINIESLFKKLNFEYEYNFVCLKIFMAKSKTKDINKLTAHEKAAWVKPKQLKEYNLIPADALIVDELLEHLQNSSQSLS